MTMIQRLFTAVFGPGVERETRQWRIELDRNGRRVSGTVRI